MMETKHPNIYKWKSFLVRHWLTVVFLGGFVTDYILLNRIDDTLDNIILLLYVVLATVSIVLFYLGVAERLDWKLSGRLRHYMPMVMQYAFGGLLSGMLIFYGRSGDWFSSAPFFILVISVIVSNELLQKHSSRLVYNLSVYFFGVFSYFVLVIPVFLGKISSAIFVGSGIMALLLVLALIQVLKLIIPHFLKMQMRFLIFSIGSFYIVLNFLYFINVIPPIPLSLTQLEVYQSVERTSIGGYRITKEETPWYEYIPFVPDYFHPLAGQGASCFSRVYAPTKLETQIVHRWEYLDDNGDWQDHYKQSYTITGKNEGGYRGFTTVTSVRDGKWRCVVENKRGQVLGKYRFVIDTTKLPKDLVTIVE